MENAIDSRMRIKTITYSDLRQKPCQFYWHGLFQITIEADVDEVAEVHSKTSPRQSSSVEGIVCNFKAYPRIQYFVVKCGEFFYEAV